MSDRVSRRELLSGLAAAGALGALAGCPLGTDRETATPTDEEEPPAGTERPDATESPTPEPANVVDVQEEGASPDGDESILPVLRSLPTSDVLVRFPPGEYLMDDMWRVDHFQNLRIEGPEATIRPTQELLGPLFGLGFRSGARDLTIRGLTFDIRGENRGPRPIHAKVSDGLLVEDVDVVGRADLNQDGMRFDVTDRNGSGVVRNMRLPDGGSTEYLITGCYVGDDHNGHLTFESCYVAGFPDNGLYASAAPGRVDVVGGAYENSGVSNVRVSGPSLVRNVTVRCDESERNLPNMRGIRLREGRDILVRNCEIEMARVTGSDGAIVCAPWLDEATIRDTSVTVGADSVPALWAKEPTSPYRPERDHPIQLDNIQVTGSAANDPTMIVSGRENALFQNVTICQPGDARDGIRLIDAGRTLLRECTVAVAGDPLIFEGADVLRTDSVLERITGEDGC